jgi:hypothetical protein
LPAPNSRDAIWRAPPRNLTRVYDIVADGQRFLMLKAAVSDTTGAPAQIVVIQHFDEELKRLVPAK